MLCDFLVKNVLFKNKINLKFKQTLSTISKSNLNTHNSSLAFISLIDDKLRRKNSALPNCISGLASCASSILFFSSSVGNIVSNFSIPSLFITALSILMIAVFKTLGGGSA
jgi:hypothetical protein